ncbi:calcium-binding protein [Tropicimonas marinistellae]|uniref:calcium-binding protein n=1 Tax=Tropicimonas marinistellae TaxID=1739787 RepID=UPI000835F1DD|nr:calcium-binding protein [Tropicimonas marinistellae]
MAIIVGGVDTAALGDELKAFLASSMPTSLEGVSEDLDDWIDKNEERLENWLDSLMERLGNWVDRVSDELSDTDADLLGDWLDDLEEALETFLDEGLEALDNLIDGTEEADEIDAGDGDDEVFAFGGDDKVLGGDGDDLLKGGKGSDKLVGGADDDKLVGGAGRDKMLGGSGDDVMLGGAGKDILKGGAGADCYVFKSVDHSAVGAKRDVVFFDDADGDEIDLRRIDACASEDGDQDFEWIGRKGFSGEEGELRLKGGVLRADVDGDGLADFSIAIEGSIWVDDLLL